MCQVVGILGDTRSIGDHITELSHCCGIGYVNRERLGPRSNKGISGYLDKNPEFIAMTICDQTVGFLFNRSVSF